MPVDLAAIRYLVEEATASGKIPRLVASIGTREGVVFEAASGVHTYGEPDTADNQVSLDSIFWLASQTKLITGLAAAQCIEKGLLTLDTYAEEFVPELKDLRILKGFDEQGEEILVERKKKVKVRHLLTHTGG